MDQEFRIQDSGFRSRNEGHEQAINRQGAQRFADLVVWQKAHQLVLAIYPESRKFPTAEQYGLTCQLRRAAVSVPSNIAEGFKKRGQADKAHFFNIAQGSLEETRYYLILAADLAYPETQRRMPLVEEVSKLLEAYRNKILTAP
jgi:four helix bundle protein